jgi:hypothetical protein
MNLTYYIGHDHREPEATLVAERSAKAYAKKPLVTRRLEHLELRQRGWFDRPWRIDEAGVMWDERDGKPFSTQFAHSRFLTPLLALQEGREGWALFTDADWLWLEDPWNILKEADPNKTVMVVPHRYAPEAKVKMDGQPQSIYGKKLWSALALWNLSRTKHFPTQEMVNQADGGYLHRFEWMPDKEIGFLSESWHWIPNASPTTQKGVEAEKNYRPLPIHAIHFTEGVPLPSMTDRKPTPFDTYWENELKDLYR